VFKTKIAAYGQNRGQKFNERVYFAYSPLCQSNLSKNGRDNQHKLVCNIPVVHIKLAKYNAYEKCSTLLFNYLSC
jgi:hypothetical protein